MRNVFLNQLIIVPAIAAAVAATLVALSVITSVILLIGLMGADYPDAAREWTARAGSMLAMCTLAWLVWFGIVVFGPWGVTLLLGSFQKVGLTAIVTWAATTLGGVLAGRSPMTSNGGGTSKSGRALGLLINVAPALFLVGYLLAIATAVHTTLPHAPITATSPHDGATRDAASVSVTTPAGTGVQVNVTPEENGMPAAWLAPAAAFAERYPAVLELGSPSGKPSPLDWTVLFVLVSGVVAIVASRRININEFSLHHFYKNRLVRCYLGATHGRARQPHPYTGFDPRDDFALSGLSPEAKEPYYGPYPILNTALNLNGCASSRSGARVLCCSGRSGPSSRTTTTRCSNASSISSRNNRGTRHGPDARKGSCVGSCGGSHPLFWFRPSAKRLRRARSALACAVLRKKIRAAKITQLMPAMVGMTIVPSYFAQSIQNRNGASTSSPTAIPLVSCVSRRLPSRLATREGWTTVSSAGEVRPAESKTRRFFIYAFALVATLLAVAGLIQLGSMWYSPSGLPAIPAAAQSAGPLAQMSANLQQPLTRLLLQLIVIILAARALGTLAGRVGQPPVIGEIAAGVMLGPSLLGWVAPGASASLFPAASLPILQLLSQIGVLLFMFVVGLEFDASHLRTRAQAAIAVSHFSIIIPFVLGVSLSLALYVEYAPPGVPFHAFALFCGIAMSITAFPVLARILAERRLTHTPLGSIAITCAAVDDVTAWSILAFVVAITTAGGAVATLLTILALSVGFMLLMIFVGRPLLRRVLSTETADDTLSKGRIAIALAVMLSSTLATEAIGIHALFGAFVAGAIMPTAGPFRAMLRDRMESISTVFLLPLFFAYTGLRTQIGLLDDGASWMVCLAIIAVATIGKLGSTIVAARWTGLSWRDAVALGSLMNTRGLMELIALNVGYELGILTPEIFAMMVLMALVTTAMTGPLLTLSLTRGRRNAPVPAGPLARSS